MGTTGRLPGTVEWTGSAVRIIDQRQLPHELVKLELRTAEEVARAIRDMAVRGAPAIGCAAALGIALAVRHSSGLEPGAFQVSLREQAELLRHARPTAVNLSWAVDRVLRAVDGLCGVEAAEAALREALRILREDLEVNRAIGRHGLSVLTKNCTVLTHCNAGALATAGYGTALGVVRAGYESGLVRRVFADETRPRLQGLQLTAWELMQDGIPVTVLADGAAAWLMRKRFVDLVIVGADRIATNGDAANKIGTYGLAVNARQHEIPFYVAAPTSTIDWSLRNGDEIPIEERSSDELTMLAGLRVGPDGVETWNPAFDVTPAELITAIITEHGVTEASSEGLLRLGAYCKGNHHG